MSDLIVESVPVYHLQHLSDRRHAPFTPANTRYITIQSLRHVSGIYFSIHVWQSPTPLISSRAEGVTSGITRVTDTMSHDTDVQSTTKPIDCSWHMPNSTRSALAEYLSGPRIPNARRFDLDEVAELEPDTNPLSLSHMMPKQERFAQECSECAVSGWSVDWTLIVRKTRYQRGGSCCSLRHFGCILFAKGIIYIQRSATMYPGVIHELTGQPSDTRRYRY